MMGNKYEKDMNWESPADNGAAITPSDTTVIAARSLYVGVAGSVSVVMAGGATLTFQGVAAGTFLPIIVQKVRATGTTASGIIGLT